MKKILIFALIASMVTIISCKKEETHLKTNPTAANTATPASNKVLKSTSATTTSQACGTPQVVALIAGQRYNVGTVTVSNDQTNLTVKYTTTGSWNLRDIHLYVGTCGQEPVTRSGDPIPGQFPYSTTLWGTAHSYTFTIPLASLSGCFCIAADATVNSCGNTQTAWGAGTRFSSRCGWATYFNYCKQSCGGNQCIQPPYLLFSGEVAWPNGVSSITVGGYSYTLATISPVLGAPSGDASAALFGVATLKVYGNMISPPASVLSDATIVETWLSTLGQLDRNSQFTAPANVEASIASVRAWETSQECQ